MSLGATPYPALSTDLYELTMAASYVDSGLQGNATFELFIRSLPSARRYLIAAGLEQALEYLSTASFQPEDIEYLRSQPVFRKSSERFFDFLKSFRFTGEVWAIPEGTVVFQQEPLLRVKAPVAEAQIAEAALLSIVTFETMIASKASRIVEAARGRSVIEFGSRRAHGPEAAVLAARAACIGGCVGTSNVEAGKRFGLSLFGTMAHSYVMAHDDELDAFRSYMQSFPDSSTLLVDTYDVLAAVDKIIASGLRPQAIRLDSGNLLDLSREVRRRLDAAGLKGAQIFASGDLDEYVITDLLAKGAQVDGFGVGSSLASSKGAPSLGGVYKLVDYESGAGQSARAKLSQGKVTYPGCKQVFRSSSGGVYREDMVTICGDEPVEGTPLLECVMRNGRRIAPRKTVAELRDRAFSEVARLPKAIRRLHHPSSYPVAFGPKLHALMGEIRAKAMERHAQAPAQELEAAVGAHASNE